MESLEIGPGAAGFFQPAEWMPHKAVLLAWPSHVDLWQEHLSGAQREMRDLCQAIADFHPETQTFRGESLWMLVPHDEAEKTAQEYLKGWPVRFLKIPFGDIWLRDTAPIFLLDTLGNSATVNFYFNGWGGKYVLPYDHQLAIEIISSVSPEGRHFSFPWVLEGGAVEVDGEGTCLTTRQCLLNRNRQLTDEAASLPLIEARLKSALGVQKILWLDHGLQNDHTDGHVDTLVRFFSPGSVLCMRSKDSQDPNKSALESIYQDLHAMTDAQGRKLKTVEVPSPGIIKDDEGRLMPASYLNFYISNTKVVVPIYGSPYDDEAVKIIRDCFPERETVGLMAREILLGGGAFHCITQQVPI